MSSSADQKRKWDERYRGTAVGAARPAQVLRDFAHLLPVQGDALDVASGLGGNAVFLARRGLRVQAWDLSEVAMAKLRDHAADQGLEITPQARDLSCERLPRAAFDVIVVSRFLDRSLPSALVAALRPGGLLFYQTFVRESVGGAQGPRDPDFLLGVNELLRLFCTLRLVAYREEGLIGDMEVGLRNEALFVGHKRP